MRKRKERKEKTLVSVLVVEGLLVEGLPVVAVLFAEECPSIVRPPVKLAAPFVPLVEVLSVSTTRFNSRKCQLLRLKAPWLIAELKLNLCT